MDNWNVVGTRVRHVLSNWIGIVICTDIEILPTATVRFWDDNKKEFIQLECVKEEIKEADLIATSQDGTPLTLQKPSQGE